MVKAKKSKTVKAPKKAVKKSPAKKPGIFSRLLGKKKPAPKPAKKTVKKTVKKQATVKKAAKPIKKTLVKPAASKKSEKIEKLKKIAKEPIPKKEPEIVEEEDFGPAYEPVLFKPRPIHLKEDKLLTAEGWKRLFEMGVVHVKTDF